ncbi:ABC transporter substrate-binding protein [Bradyrhizobium sp. KBS0727]|uniref:ABC transporter substrate-binding protein n=1 Tax=unclassified Bradyrhizobium TaxID=2631580 RepID=UPI00110E2467|nr:MULTISPECIES: ABC transporter substrate-binding protein [unclassified Bradyrhizobium]QDW38502.1 ABC transporter substrate-binding protein [Bradyrhizobium sp. KBS0725]QDW45105.1 ABC transporter substrate-binding protein [Bradyrhizobium sp. KBS0727]
MIDRRRVIVSIGGAALAWPLPARTEPSRTVARIGIVSVGGPSADMTGALPSNRSVRAFLRGMAELGYVYGRDLVTEPRGTDTMSAVVDLVGLQVDVIVATGAGTALSLLKQATTTIPIVMTAAPDPVGEGFVQNLARPGGNFTGMSLQSLELTGKRLQLLKELVPGAGTVGILWDSTSPKIWPVAQAFGQTLGWKLLSIEIHDPREIAVAFNTAADAGADALLVSASALLFSRAREIAELAALRRLPTMYELRPFVDGGGLVSYGANIEDIWRRAASYVDKILRGARPAELPIEQPTKFELVINSRAATALGLTISPSILIRADEVID